MVIMEFAMGWDLDNEDLLLIPRIKGKIEAIFLSDTVTAGQFKIQIQVSKSRSN